MISASLYIGVSPSILNIVQSRISLTISVGLGPCHYRGCVRQRTTSLTAFVDDTVLLKLQTHADLVALFVEFIRDIKRPEGLDGRDERRPGPAATTGERAPTEVTGPTPGKAHQAQTSEEGQDHPGG